jgi:putative transcription factor
MKKMQCELCGRECDCKPAIVDGVRMMLCPGCMHHGKSVKIQPKSDVSHKPNLNRVKSHRTVDIYKDMSKELISNWNTLIKNAREKKKLTREQLGFRIGERTVTIAKIENGDLRPSDKVIKKIEKELDIKLIGEIDKAPSYALGSHSSNSLTLGDFIKKEED